MTIKKNTDITFPKIKNKQCNKRKFAAEFWGECVMMARNSAANLRILHCLFLIFGNVMSVFFLIVIGKKIFVAICLFFLCLFFSFLVLFCCYFKFVVAIVIIVSVATTLQSLLYISLFCPFICRCVSIYVLCTHTLFCWIVHPIVACVKYLFVVFVSMQ